MFEEKDLKLIRALEKVIADGDFLLKGRAVPGFIMILQWVKGLEEKIENDLKSKSKKKVKK